MDVLSWGKNAAGERIGGWYIHHRPKVQDSYQICHLGSSSEQKKLGLSEY